ncbi:PTS sugar transporter subunit IIB [Lactobacillus sp. ESL0684]|uniref:PTS sugar transporter subunit IIB n=1 Tax=Lactobacillus sp. ESL0684 TaxID=2983213 RepID=UPI0023F69D34|nr:PTS sugar transporter subunit IIB [Lactobacillus sp. ESL0684]WEV43575.1 PTS sugar transporter subunit IIB [Lactobacillus sp. ESL0684]
MAKINIMLNCNQGMSTSLLVTKMQEAAKSQALDANIFACAASEADKYIENGDIDCILLGPQVKYMKDDFINNKAKGAGKNGKDIPVDVINIQDYGMMKGKEVLNKAISLINA